jgi:hypothetical protein
MIAAASTSGAHSAVSRVTGHHAGSASAGSAKTDASSAIPVRGSIASTDDAPAASTASDHRSASAASTSKRNAR